MIRQLIIVYQWVVDRWGWVYICRYFSGWNILHSHIFWLQKLASWDWARGQPNCDSWIYVQNTNYSESFYIGLCFLLPLTPIWKKNIKTSWYTSGGTIFTEKFTLQNWDCSKSPQKADFMNAFPKFLFVSISYHFLLGTSWSTPIGTSVRRSSGRSSGVAVRAVDCWQWRSGH